VNRSAEFVAVAVCFAVLGFVAAGTVALRCPAAARQTAYPAPAPGYYLHARGGYPVWYVTRRPRNWDELESLSMERAASDPGWCGVVKVRDRKTTPDSDTPLDPSCWRMASGMLLVGDPAFLDEVAELLARD
jgi:hypothetical protein